MSGPSRSPSVTLVVALLFLVPLAARSLSGDCVDNGHATIAAAWDPVSGTRYPYTEDLVHHTTDKPVGDVVTIGYHDDLHWTKIQSGCAAFGEYNVNASGPVNVLLRASLRLMYRPTQTASPGTRYEVQLRLGRSAGDPSPLIVTTEMRRLGERSPRSDRFAATVQDLPAGNYVYSLWFRLLDGPATNRVTIGLQWITAQGVPNVYPSVRSVAGGDDVVTTDWIRIGGDDLTFTNAYPLDLVLQSSFVVASAYDGDALSLRWSLDGSDAGDQVGTIAIPTLLPDGETTFDHRAVVAPGVHTLRLYARTTRGGVRLQGVVTELVSFPSAMTRPGIIPMQQAIRTDPMTVTTAGSDPPPLSLSSICGRWTKVLDFTLEPLAGSLSWTLEGYIEILGGEGAGYAQIAIQAEHDELDRADTSRMIVNHTDMGMFEVQYAPGHDGVYFFGDCSKWGDYGKGDRMSLWVRRIEGCNDAPYGGTTGIGRRWLSIKMLPSEGRHLP
jgi:hypothetical protein